MHEPFLLIVAGPNGAGKTTLTKSLRQRGIDFGEYINPDDIADELQGTYDERVARAQAVADHRREACIEEKRSFSFETVMSHPSKVDILVRAKEAGFFVQLFFVGTDDPQTNIERVALRVLQGGHDVPTDKIVSRWTRTMELLHRAIRASDQAFVFDNSAAGNASTGPRLIFRRNISEEWAAPQIEQRPPIPAWVRRFVLDALGITSIIVHPRFRGVISPRSMGPATGVLSEAKESENKANVARILPHNTDAERALLVAILAENEAFYQVSDFLEPIHFFDSFHRRVYEIATSLIRAGKIATPITLSTFLPSDIDISGLSVRQYLPGVIVDELKGLGAKEYGQAVYDLAMRRAIITICEDVSNSAYDARRNLTPQLLIEEAERRLIELAQTGRYHGGMQRFSEALVAAVDTAARAYARDGEHAGLATGLKDLDWMTGGLQRSDLIVLAGRPAMGKTALATNIAYNVADAWSGEVLPDGSVETKSGGIVGFFSLAMSAEQLATRIIAQQSEIPSDRIRRGEIDPADFDRIAAVARQMEMMPLYIDDTGGLSVEQIITRARRLKQSRGLDFLIVDDLQLLHDATRRAVESRGRKMDQVTTRLKALAKELNVPILALSQLSPQVDKRDDKRPRLTDFRELRTVDQDADVVIFVLREEEYLRGNEPRIGTEEHFRWQNEMEAVYGKAEIIVGKQRHGPTGTMHLNFDARVARFRDLSPN